MVSAFLRAAIPAFLMALVLSAFCSPISPAFAYEDQITVGLDLGYAARLSGARPHHGPLTGVVSSIGIDPLWSLRGRVSYGYLPDPQPLHLFLTSADILYLVDILEYVPFAGIGLDGAGALSGSELDIDLAVHAAVGVDYLLSRSLIVGFEVRPLVFLTHYDREPLHIFINATVSASFDM